MYGGTILGPAILAFILGWVTGIFSPGVRRMIAPKYFRKSLCIGNISLSDPVFGSYWYISVESRTIPLWNLLVSSIRNVSATISYIDSKRGDRVVHSTYWLPLIYYIGLETDDKGNRVKIDEQGGNKDIELELESGHTSLGKWLFKGAIIEGAMQEVSPIKLEK